MAYNNNGDVSKDSRFVDDSCEMPYNHKAKVRYVKGMKAEILKGLIARGMRAEKLKSFINGNIKAHKLKGMESIAVSRLARLKLWAVRATTLFLLWAVFMQLKALCHTFPSFSKYSSFPPPSKYILHLYLYICVRQICM